MNTKVLLLGVALAGALSISFHVAAETFDAKSVVTRQERIRRAVETNSAGFSDVPVEKKQELLQRQVELLALIGNRSYSQLSEAEREQALEQIAWIDEVATKAADERMVCERVRVAGSNLMQRVCTTARAQRESQEAARRMLMTGNRTSPRPDTP